MWQFESEFSMLLDRKRRDNCMPPSPDLLPFDFFSTCATKLFHLMN
jgi:hypothetical protein